MSLWNCSILVFVWQLPEPHRSCSAFGAWDSQNHGAIFLPDWESHPRPARAHLPAGTVPSTRLWALKPFPGTQIPEEELQRGLENVLSFL